MTLTRTHILLAGLLWSTLLLALPPAANAGQILGAPLYIGLGSGLVGWWTMNGADTSINSSGIMTVLDRSGNGNTGTSPSVAATPEKTVGKIGQALDFSGSASNPRVDVNSPSSLTNMSPISISVWIYPRSFANNPGIVGKGGEPGFAGTWDLNLYDGAQDGLEFYINGSASLNVISYSTNPITLNQWQHVAVVWDGSATAANVRMYVNGTLLPHDEEQDLISRFDDTDVDFDIGYSNLSGDRPFNGLIDEVRIYNRILSPDEIKRLYKIGSTLKYGAPNSNGSLSNGLVGWWTMDGNDVAGSVAYDRSGNVNNGTLTNGPTPAIGKIGQALNFDGTNDYVVAAANGFVSTDQVSVSMWVKPGALTARRLFFFRDGSVDAMMITQNGDSGNFLHVVTGNATPGEPTLRAAATPGEWYHVVGIYSAGSGASKVVQDGYLNGVRMTDNTGGEWSGTSSGDGNFYMGCNSDGGSCGDAVIDDVRIYNRALTPDEIKRLYKMGSTLKQGVASSNGSLSSGLVGWWTFDGKETSVNGAGVLSARDLSGNGLHGTAPSAAASPAKTIGKIGQALVVDSVADSYLQVPDNAALQIQDITIAVWVFARVSGTFLGKEGPSNNYDSYALRFGQTTTFCIEPSNTKDVCLTSAFTVPLQTWAFIVATWDGATMKLYKDGVQDANTATQTNVNEYAANPLFIGRESNIAGPTGSIDDLRIYNRVLSADEIKRLYNMGR